jgi:hypothetical protein
MRGSEMGTEGDDIADDVPRPLRHATPLSMSPSEFERYTVHLLGQMVQAVENLTVTFNEEIETPDGTYDIDATARFRLAGMDFLVLVECKRHSHPVKRDVVAILKDKVRSAGAQKGVVFSTAPFQSGALRYASRHGIGLVHVTDAGPTYLVRSIISLQPSDLEAARVPVGHCWELTPGGTLTGTLLDDNPAGVLELLTSKATDG